MATSLFNLLCPLLLLLLGAIPLASTATVDLNFDVGWVTANPDQLAERPVIGINGKWPLPFLNITKGDRVLLNMTNSLANQSTSIHFHGLFQNGTNSMDGPVGVTQCDVPPGSSMIYNFTVDQPGNYWYHTHSRGQIIDGFRAQFIVHDPQNPYAGEYDEEIAMTMSDWYHDQARTLLPQFVSYKNPTGAEPVPDSALMNDSQNVTFSVQPGKTYYLRLTNVGTFASQYFWIEGHTMKIISVDGVYTEPADAEMIYLSVAQRYGVLVTTKNDTSANFAIVSSMDTSLFDVTPSTLNTNVTGWLMYNETAPKPVPTLLDEFDAYDDFNLVPHDGRELYDQVDYSVKLDLKMDNLGDGANYAFFNDISYTTPKVPSLYTALSSGSLANNSAIYGGYTNTFVLQQGDIVELILNNNDGGKHPFHLHGHDFQLVVRGDENFGDYDPNNHTALPSKPMRRDVVTVQPQSNFAIRWRADNPGVWFFHCHINWHLDTGLAATFIEAPLALQSQVIPQNHYDVCAAAGLPTKGNAAANTVDLLDLTGQNKEVTPLPAGFTTRGIVALVFSCVSAFLGIAMIMWYGSAPLGTAELASAKKYVKRNEQGSTSS